MRPSILSAAASIIRDATIPMAEATAKIKINSVDPSQLPLANHNPAKIAGAMVMSAIRLRKLNFMRRILMQTCPASTL